MSETAVSTDSNGSDPNKIRQEDIQELKAILRELIQGDDSIKETCSQEGLGKEDVVEQASMMLAESNFDEISDLLEELKSAQKDRDILLKQGDPWYVNAAIAAVIIGILGLFALLAVGIAKWTGHLLRWPLWLFVVSPLVPLFGGGVVFLRRESGDSAITSATVEAERLKSSLSEVLRLLVVTPAIEKLMSLRLTDPSDDVVELEVTPSLSSRIESRSRIQTESYRDVFANLRSTGGATIGLAGSRGVGKSELLGAFCNDPDEQPSIKSGGVIGVIIPAPIVYEARSFLRALIRRLAEAVPEFNKSADRQNKLVTSRRSFTILLLAALCLVSGLALEPRWVHAGRHTVGLALIASAGLLILVWVILLIANSRAWETIKITMELLRFTFRITFLVLGVPSLFAGMSSDLEAISARINQAQRRLLSSAAADVVQRIGYVEKISASSETSLAWNNFGFKRDAGVDLDQIPLTEPDLVAELSKLVAALHRGGYQIRIGIDELDKLASGEEAERFLTGIKVLFSIRYCSFLLTISQNAASQFARRGMPIRDVFDSSLDTVIVVRPLNFFEARRLIRTRLSARNSDKISDSQVLLCHYLAGGLPRDLLRFCRQLGELNFKAGGNSTLQNLMDQLLYVEIDSRIDGVRFALQSQENGEVRAVFMAELDRLTEAVAHKDVFRTLDWFLSTDPTFARLCQHANPDVTDADVSYLKDDNKRENWIQDSRRQLYSFAYFIETVRQAFERVKTLNPAARGATECPEKLEFLAEARQWMELDAATGWRRTTKARLMFGLALPGQTPPSSDEQKGSE